jgi:hypothetical protein
LTVLGGRRRKKKNEKVEGQNKKDEGEDQKKDAGAEQER